MTTQWVYLNDTARQDLIDHLDHPPDDDTIRAHLGDVGLGIIRAEDADLPIPPRFVVATGASLVYLETGAFPEGLESQLQSAVRTLEARTGKTFGGTENPLILTVQGATRGMIPDPIDEVRYIGLTLDTCPPLAARGNDPTFPYRMYTGMVAAFAETAHGIDRRTIYDPEEPMDGGLDEADWKEIVVAALDRYRERCGEPFPDDPYRQLTYVLRAIFRAWEDPHVAWYREAMNIPYDWGVGVSVAAHVFGNLGPVSGSGVVFSRHPVTGEKRLYGGYMPGVAFDDDPQSNALQPDGLAALKAQDPEMYRRLMDVVRQAEAHFRDVQALGFTVEDGRLWVLASRHAPRSARAAVRFARDLRDEGLLTQDEARERLRTRGSMAQIHPEISPETAAWARAADRLLARGTGISAGAAVGLAVFAADAAQAYVEQGQAVILIREETTPDDLPGLLASQGVVVQRAFPFSNSVSVLLDLKVPLVINVPGMEIDAAAGTARVGDRVIREGDVITLDGLTGELFLGPMPLRPSPVLGAILDL
jgi:pyruvate,orthophosphate dikinase